MTEVPRLLWEPTEQGIADATITRFAAWAGRRAGREFADYDALWRWSTDDLDGFWRAIIEFCGLELAGDGADGPVLAQERMPGARWLPGATVSYPAHVFRGRDPDAVAIHHTSEVRPQLERWSWGRLEAETRQIAAGLAACGVGPGDRVCAYLPNIPEAIAACLACMWLGAIWSSAAPEFGPRSVIDRFAQIEPKVLLAIDGYRYGGRAFDRSAEVAEIAAGLGEQAVAPRLVRFGYLDGSGWEPGFLGDGEALGPPRPAGFTDPLWVLYSSGTTGLPKPIVHSHGGILIEQLKHHHLHLDARPQDNVFWFSTTGWMMWNFLVGVLLTGASITLFDGNPGYPTLDRLWDLAAEAQISIFGTSAAFIAACMKAEIHPAAGRDLSALRAVGSTGSPLSSDAFDWIYDEFGAATWLFSTSGGTDLCTSFLGGVPTLPVHAGELQARLLGAAVAAWDPEGRPLIDAVGELVCTRPMPSMPLFLWGDEDGSRMRDSYFEPYPGVWRHGDWLTITARGTGIVHGRSDATINRGGVRMGTAEIYRAVLAVDAVLDALVVDLPSAQDGRGDGWIELFVVLREGVELDDEVTVAIRRRVREDCSPRHVPDAISVAPAIPRTLSGKVLEVPVKRILDGADPAKVVSRESLADPAALDWFIRYRQSSGG